MAGCTPAFEAPKGTVALPIADRGWEAGAPLEGWCGEASIQMAALHFGTLLPQAEINRLGRPAHPDLWEDDLPTALKAIGLRFETGPKKHPAKLLSWTVTRLRAGHPVILGLKMVPTAHPEWEVDHIVLAVGFSPSGLLINTNMAPGQVTAAWSGLRSTRGSKRLSLVNEAGSVVGLAITGFPRDVR